MCKPLHASTSNTLHNDVALPALFSLEDISSALCLQALHSEPSADNNPRLLAVQLLAPRLLWSTLTGEAAARL